MFREMRDLFLFSVSVVDLFVLEILLVPIGLRKAARERVRLRAGRWQGQGHVVGTALDRGKVVHD